MDDRKEARLIVQQIKLRIATVSTLTKTVSRQMLENVKRLLPVTHCQMGKQHV